MSVANLSALVASWPLTRLRQYELKKRSGGLGGGLMLESALVVGLALAAFVPLLQIRDDLSRSVAFVAQVELIARIIEVVVDDEHVFDKDRSLGERLLHSLVSPEVLRQRQRIKDNKSGLLVQKLGQLVFAMAVLNQTLLFLEERGDLRFGHWIMCYVLFPLKTYATLAMHGLVVQLVFLAFDNSLVRGFIVRPLASQSVGEFYSRRWHLPMHDILHRHVYHKIKSKFGLGRQTATAATFLVSSLYHLVQIHIGGIQYESLDALGLILYFAWSAFIVCAENTSPLVDSWRRRQPSLWTALCIVVPLPLFVSPFLRIEGLEGPL